MRTITPRALVLWTLVVLVGSCATDEAPPPPSSTVAIGMASASGDGQTATVAAAVANALRVMVTESGAPVSGRTVAWSTPDVGGSVSATSSTDTDGIATTQWTLGQMAGSQTARATLSGATGSPVTFGATATAGPAATIAKTGGDAQSGFVNTMLADPLQATASDQFGNAVGGVGVMWQVMTGTATVNPTSSNSSSAGQAETVVTLGGTAGAITIQAMSTGLAGSPLSYSATALTLPTMVTVQVVNDLFQPANITIAAGGTVTWNWPVTATNPHNVSPDATEPARNADPAPGPQTYQFMFNTPGTYRYFCENHGAPNGGGMSGTVTVI